MPAGMKPSRQALIPFLDETGRLTDEGVLESYRHGSETHAAVEILLKGPEERLPAGIHFLDKDGHKREEVRLRWWDQDATTFRKAALGMDGREDEIPDSTLPTDYRYHEAKPVFFGHYWLTGQPDLLGLRLMRPGHIHAGPCPRQVIVRGVGK
jgi:hypothetical protein